MQETAGLIFANKQKVFKNILTNSPVYYILHNESSDVFKNVYLENENIYYKEDNDERYTTRSKGQNG